LQAEIIIFICLSAKCAYKRLVKLLKRTLWVVFAILAILIGLYPGIYFLVDRQFGLLGSKDEELLGSTIWNGAFYTHIVLGGLSLLIGWSQFSSRLRNARLDLHRLVGKIYIISVLLSALAGIYIGFFATGGFVASLGFISLGCIWFLTTLLAYFKVRKGDIDAHEVMMIYSYAACFAAVTLRIWLPLLIMIFNDFVPAYRIVAWLCWIPNLIVAFYLIRRIQKYRQQPINQI